MAKKATVVEEKDKAVKSGYVAITTFTYKDQTFHYNSEIPADFTEEDIEYLSSNKNKLNRPIIEKV